MITLKNYEVRHQNFKVYVVLFVYKNIGYYCNMIGLISEESLTFGLLTFLMMRFEVGAHEFCIMLCISMIPIHSCV